MTNLEDERPSLAVKVGEKTLAIGSPESKILWAMLVINVKDARYYIYLYNNRHSFDVDVYNRVMTYFEAITILGLTCEEFLEKTKNL